METKTCRKCKQEKLMTEFSKKKGKLLQSQCKSCKALYYREWYRSNGRKRSKNYMEAILVWQKNHRIVNNVGNKVFHALRTGRLVKALSCIICGKVGKINAHHDNYSKPFDILWVCSSCHKKIHLGLLEKESIK